jgi:hypothetical protein
MQGSSSINEFLMRCMQSDLQPDEFGRFPQLIPNQQPEMQPIVITIDDDDTEQYGSTVTDLPPVVEKPKSAYN